MWLLHARTRKLESFVDDRQTLTEYAILSHTWESQEVTFDDIHMDYASTMRGYRKIDFACSQALKDGIEYVWVDTCCIDKRSSAELSEAINSMYRWYYDARLCYAYLSDLDWKDEGHSVDSKSESFYDWGTDVAASRWFKRGWTLQELIAPKEVKFYDAKWNWLGSKIDLVDDLEAITKISSAVLKDRAQLRRASVAQRMSWAAGRSTSRVEDQSYALLGLFDVNMPLLYGEGTKAFTRLQEEIIRSQDWSDRDHSILLWDRDDRYLLAPSPRDFVYGHRIISWTPPRDETFEISKKGLRMTVLARRETSVAVSNEQSDHNAADCSGNDTTDILVVVLNCRYDDNTQLHQLAIRVQRRPRIATLGHSTQDEDPDDRVYDKLPGTTIVSHLELFEFIPMDITIARKPYCWPSQSIRKLSIAGGLMQIEDCPTNSIVWHRGHAIVQLEMDDDVRARGNVGVRKRIDTEQWPDLVLDICLVHETRGAPEVSVSIEGGGRFEFREGEQHVVKIENRKVLRITASYVLMDEDLLWHLELTRPVLENDVSDRQILGRMASNEMRRTPFFQPAGRGLVLGHATTLPEVGQRFEALPEVVNAQLMNAAAPLLQEQSQQRHTLMALADAVERIQRQIESLEPRHEIASQEVDDLEPRPSHTRNLRSRIDQGRRPLRALRSLILGYLGRRPPSEPETPVSTEMSEDGSVIVYSGGRHKNDGSSAINNEIYELDARPRSIYELAGREILDSTDSTRAREQTDFQSSSDSDPSIEDCDDGEFSFVESIFDLVEEIPQTLRVGHDPSSSMIPLRSLPRDCEAMTSDLTGEASSEKPDESDDAWDVVSPDDSSVLTTE